MYLAEFPFGFIIPFILADKGWTAVAGEGASTAVKKGWTAVAGEGASTAVNKGWTAIVGEDWTVDEGWLYLYLFLSLSNIGRSLLSSSSSLSPSCISIDDDWFDLNSSNVLDVTEDLLDDYHKFG